MVKTQLSMVNCTNKEQIAINGWNEKKKKKITYNESQLNAIRMKRCNLLFNWWLLVPVNTELIGLESECLRYFFFRFFSLLLRTQQHCTTIILVILFTCSRSNQHFGLPIQCVATKIKIKQYISLSSVHV